MIVQNKSVKGKPLTDVKSPVCAMNNAMSFIALDFIALDFGLQMEFFGLLALFRADDVESHL